MTSNPNNKSKHPKKPEIIKHQYPCAAFLGERSCSICRHIADERTAWMDEQAQDFKKQPCRSCLHYSPIKFQNHSECEGCRHAYSKETAESKALFSHFTPTEGV
jgi:hypothetical protein